MIHLALPFNADGIKTLYGLNDIQVPHPIFLGQSEASLLNTTNNLTIPEKNYFFSCVDDTLLVSPVTGRVVRVDQEPQGYLEYVCRRPSWKTLFGLKPAIGIHDTHFLVLETNDGLVRLEHVITNLRKGSKLDQGEDIGQVGGYCGFPHIHMYGVTTISDTVPSQQLQFDDLPTKTNFYYEATVIELQKRQLGSLSLTDQQKRISDTEGFNAFCYDCMSRADSMERLSRE